MMKLIFLVILPVAWCYGTSGGGGSFSYVDSTGNRYGGSYGVKDGKVVSATGDINPEHFADTAFHGDNIGPNFGPEYLSNLENILQEFPAFNNFPGFGFPGFDYGMPNPVPGLKNAAFASAAAGPGFNHHIASIFPGNPANPNINKVNHYADSATPNRAGFVSVSSNSFASSQNVDGKESTLREAETYVNDNGKITHYKVRN
ncbi:uncharacterized protein LOC113496625 isoform X2 [Trichoplusia ni]|uniref:Uncharacterized protein LOC113496625 isoform X2 n=1 Tax=Trichoplusia ni TaxID=7111 RepID=A0A7E5VTR5_TRINI|nr:uncharacterized protein LOC113496625 isoform X2 [Trichoplusia ni]